MTEKNVDDGSKNNASRPHDQPKAEEQTPRVKVRVDIRGGAVGGNGVFYP